MIRTKGIFCQLGRYSLLMLLFIALNATLACAQQPAEQKATPINTTEVATYIRKAFNIPANIGVTVTEEQTSTVPGLRMVKVNFASDKGAQSQDAWIANDGKTLLVGKTFDMSVDPFKQNLSKMNLEGAPVSGKADAKVTIVEYTDFQCPFCSRAHVTVEQLLKDYDGKIKV